MRKVFLSAAFGFGFISFASCANAQEATRQRPWGYRTATAAHTTPAHILRTGHWQYPVGATGIADGRPYSVYYRGPIGSRGQYYREEHGWQWGTVDADGIIRLDHPLRATDITMYQWKK